jgi:hypothetical protein
MVSIIA